MNEFTDKIITTPSLQVSDSSYPHCIKVKGSVLLHGDDAIHLPECRRVGEIRMCQSIRHVPKLEQIGEFAIQPPNRFRSRLIEQIYKAVSSPCWSSDMWGDFMHDTPGSILLEAFDPDHDLPADVKAVLSSNLCPASKAIILFGRDVLVLAFRNSIKVFLKECHEYLQEHDPQISND